MHTTEFGIRIEADCKGKRDLGCTKHGVAIIRLTENSIFAVWGDRPPPRYFVGWNTANAFAIWVPFTDTSIR